MKKLVDSSRAASQPIPLFMPTSLLATPPNFPIFLAAWGACLSFSGLVMYSVCRVGGWVGGVAGWVGGVGWRGGVGWGWVGWENNVIGASTHTWCNISVRSLALLSYPHVRHATPTWCYVETCLLHLPTDLMLRCNMSLALAAGCWIWWKASCFVTTLDVRCGTLWESWPKIVTK